MSGSIPPVTLWSRSYLVIMSPIGRVFIILNLILAGAFVGFSGTFLQRQFNYKTAYEKLNTDTKAQIGQLSSDNERLRGEVSTMTTSKNTLEQELGSTRNDLANANDEVKRLRESHASKDADLKKLASEIAGIKTNADVAFSQSQKAYEASTAALKEKDEAVRAKDAAEAENRDLKGQVASLQELGQKKDVQLADAAAEKGRLQLLVDVAKNKGFLEQMAVPKLAGTVAQVSGKLCTVMVTDNPTSAEIKPGYAFAIYDASGYKGEARVTSVDAERNAAFCTLDVKSGDIKMGDKASTHLSGL